VLGFSLLVLWMRDFPGLGQQLGFSAGKGLGAIVREALLWSVPAVLFNQAYWALVGQRVAGAVQSASQAPAAMTVLKGSPLALVSVGVIAAPVLEELLFRGMFLNLLLRWVKNPHLAVAIQAVVFVAFHNLSYPITFAVGVGMAQRYIDACLFAYARRHTDSIFVPLAMHMTGNLISVVEQLWQ